MVQSDKSIILIPNIPFQIKIIDTDLNIVIIAYPNGEIDILKLFTDI
jgi:hypothetical protein